MRGGRPATERIVTREAGGGWSDRPSPVRRGTRVLALSSVTEGVTELDVGGGDTLLAGWWDAAGQTALSSLLGDVLAAGDEVGAISSLRGASPSTRHAVADDLNWGPSAITAASGAQSSHSNTNVPSSASIQGPTEANMAVNGEMLGRVLEAVVVAGGVSESVPSVEGLTREEGLEVADELIARGWLTARVQNRGDDRLMSVHEIRITAAGRSALADLRRVHRRASSTKPKPSSLEEKKRKRLEYMNSLYRATNGSTYATVDMWELGEELDWENAEIDHTVEYLEAEGLLQYVAMGGMIGITHAGVMEVEQSLSRPEVPTEHFPPSVNIMHVQQMVGSQIQQGTAASSQQLEYVSPESVEGIRDLIRQLREDVLPVVDLDADEQEELEAELDVAERHLKSRRPNAVSVRRSLERVGGLLREATVAAGSAVQLADYVMKLHQLLPGI